MNSQCMDCDPPHQPLYANIIHFSFYERYAKRLSPPRLSEVPHFPAFFVIRVPSDPLQHLLIEPLIFRLQRSKVRGSKRHTS
jgi:hypothetical protein